MTNKELKQELARLKAVMAKREKEFNRLFVGKNRKILKLQERVEVLKFAVRSWKTWRERE